MTDNDPPAPAARSSLVGIAASVASRTTLVLALLFYFGWASARSSYGYFGIDTSLLGFSTSDYLLRSVSSAYQPLLTVGLIAVVAVLVHQALARRARGRDAPAWLRGVPFAALIVAAGCVGVGVVGLIDDGFGRSLRTWLPGLLAIGGAAGVYANRVWPTFRGGPASGDAGETDQDRDVRHALLLGLTLLGLFWWTGLFASHNGRHRAERFAHALPSASAVWVYSARSLSLPLPEKCALGERLPATEAYRYRYSGLRLLVHSGGRYFLVPACWRHGAGDGTGVTYEIPDDPGVRLDLRPPV